MIFDFKTDYKRLLKVSTLAFFVIGLSSCDSPTRSRSAYRGSSSSNSGPLFSSGFNSPGGDTGTGSGTGTGADPTQTPSPTPTSGGSAVVTDGIYPANAVPQEASHCSWSTDGSSGFSFTHSYTGDYTLCRAQGSETVYYLQTKVPSSQSIPLCLIPTTHIQTPSGSKSVYIGEPRCVHNTDNTKVYKIVLYKNRIYYTNYPITGVMIMKDELVEYPQPYMGWYLNPDAYMFCIQYLANYGSDAFCDTFDSMGQYVYHEF